MHRSARAGLLSMTFVSLVACSPAGEPAESPGPAPVSEQPHEIRRSPVARTLEVRIVERRTDDVGSVLQVSTAGRRGTLYAGHDTPLAAAAEANEVLTLELADEPGREADYAGGALVLRGETHRVVAFDAWMLPGDTISHGSLVGVWRVPKAGRTILAPGGMRSPGVPQFAYDGRHVVLRLVTEKDWMWRSSDDRYKLETRWVLAEDGRDELQYRSPFGGWQVLAALVNEGPARRLVLAESDRTWPLERVRKAADADEDDRALVVDRPAHDASTKPTDSPPAAGPSRAPPVPR